MSDTTPIPPPRALLWLLLWWRMVVPRLRFFLLLIVLVVPMTNCNCAGGDGDGLRLVDGFAVQPFSALPTTAILSSSLSLSKFEAAKSAAAKSTVEEAEALSAAAVAPPPPVSVKTRRSGGTSFLYQQQQQLQQQQQQQEKQEQPSPSNIVAVAQQHASKQRGSKQYQKAWWQWVPLAIAAIREEVSVTLLDANTITSSSSSTNSNSSSTTNTTTITSTDLVTDTRLAFEELFFALGVAADTGIMPSFANATARIGYALQFFGRATSLATFFLATYRTTSNTTSNTTTTPILPVYPTFWSQALLGTTHHTNYNNKNKKIQESNTTPGCSILAPTGGSDTSSVSSSSSGGGRPGPKIPIRPYNIVSLGGGPGFDFVGVALAATFAWCTTVTPATATTVSPPPRLHVSVLDYEAGWETVVTAMAAATCKIVGEGGSNRTTAGGGGGPPPVVSARWAGTCDITKSLCHDPVNAQCFQLVVPQDTGNEDEDDNEAPSAIPAQLIICQYCVAENSQRLRSSQYIFFRELIETIPVGTLLLFTEVVPRVWPEFVQHLDASGLLSQVHIGFCQGYRGKQCMVQKITPKQKHPLENTPPPTTAAADSAAVLLDDRTRDQLQQFETLARAHQRKIHNGWERQERKYNKSKSAEYHRRRGVTVRTPVITTHQKGGTRDSS